MAAPYPYQRTANSTTTDGAEMSTLIELVFQDRAGVQAEEWLTFQTRVPLPLPLGLPTVELAALVRVRDMLDKQIAALQSL